MPDDSPLLKAALAYAARGWPVFPCAKLGKPPAIPRDKGGRAFEDATTDPDRIRAMWEAYPDANIGFCPGSAGLLVVDEDPTADHGELHRATGGLPDTKLLVRTPRDGTHRYFALAEGETVPPSASRIAPGVDIRSSGSYVLLPPSYVVDRKKGIDGGYAWVNWPEPKPAYRSEGLLAACGAKRKKSDNAQRWLIDPDLPENIAAAIEYIHSERCQPAIEGQGGDKRTYDTAAMMRSFGLSEDTALRILDEVYSTKCFPPWDYDELAVKVQNAYAYATSAPGNMTAAYRKAMVAEYFKPQQRDTGDEPGGGLELTAGRYRFVNRDGIDDIEEPTWLIPNLLPEGAHALLVAQRSSFKTFLALDIGLTIASGAKSKAMPWQGVSNTGPVLIAMGEGRSGVKQRIRAWEEVHNEGKKVGDIVVVDPVPLVAAGEEDWQGFIDAAKQWYGQYRLVVLDTAGRAMAGLNENAQEHASKLTLLVSRLQQELGAAVLILAHEGHEAKGRKSGSGVFENDADTVVVASREGKGMTVKLAMTKQKEWAEWEQPQELRMQLQGKTLVPVRDKEAKKEEPPDRPMKPVDPPPFVPTTAAVSVLDKAVQQVLQANPTRAWNTRDLAEAVAMRPELENVSSSSLRTRLLIQLRERKDTVANRSYDPATKRWRHVG